jgi:GAF domain-containing protein
MENAFLDPDTDNAEAGAFDALARFVISEHTIEQALQLVVDLARPAVGEADAVGVSLLRKGSVMTAAATGPRTLAVDHLQYQAGSGPCLQAIKDGEVQIVRAMLTESRWPDFTNKALYEGVQSILACPLKTDGEVLGALNFYSSHEQGFDSRAVSVGEAFAVRASVLLLNVSRYQAASELASQLEEALQSRAVIDQAKGILMEREKISSDEAFDRLKLGSQHSNIKVRELAQRIVAGVAEIDH